MNKELIPIENFSGYFITREGKVYSNFKGIKEVKGRPARNGYLRVYMRDDRDKKRKDRFVHRLVAQTFIPNPLKKRVVHHIDTDRANNCVDNLEWVTYAENNQDTMDRGIVKRCEITGRFHKVNS